MNRFQKINKRPRWEGIIFADVDQSISQISIVEAKPTSELSSYIESIWFMNWNITNPEGMKCIVAPNPCTKFVVLQKDAITYRPLLIGARENADIFSHTGQGSVMGFDFQPGALYPILKKPMNAWPLSGLYADEFFANLPPLPTDSWSEENLSQWLNNFEDYLIKKLMNSKGHNYKEIQAMMEGILGGSLQSLDDLAQKCSMSIRTLQRVFQKEIGLSPRDVLRIARFNHAIRQIGQDDFTAFTEVALASGFFDQAHMVNEFQKLVSTPPSKFKRYL